MATNAGDGSDGRGRRSHTGSGPPPLRAFDQAPPEQGGAPFEALAPDPYAADSPNLSPPGPPVQARGTRQTSIKPRQKAKTASRLQRFCLRPLRAAARGCAVAVPLLLLAVGLLYLKLMNSPLSVPFLVEPITRALNTELSGLTVAVEDAVLHLSPRGGLEFRLKTVRVLDKQDTPVAVAAFAAIELSWRALRSARISPAHIELIEPSIRLNYDERGDLSVSVGDGAERRIASTAARPTPTLETATSLPVAGRGTEPDRKSTRLNSSHGKLSRMPSSA